MRREKSVFEKWFSWSRHRKRFGANKYMSDLNDMDFSQLKGAIINDVDLEYTHGAEKELGAHFSNLRKEFSGQSELLYFHSKLIVLIRRECDVEKNFVLFVELWQSEKEFLLNNLNTRWLVSASDTFFDYSENSVDKAAALAISSLVNTVKLCETERYIEGSKDSFLNKGLDMNMGEKRVALWDGTSAFAVGTDDTLRNFRWRIERFYKKESTSVVIPIFREIFIRLSDKETIYSRFKQVHQRSRTGWW